MSKAYLGSFHGKVTPGANMVDIFKENELKKNTNSILGYGPMVLRKFAVSAPAGTVIEINGQELPLFSGVFELGRDEIEIHSLVFKGDAVEVFIYYMY